MRRVLVVLLGLMAATLPASEEPRPLITDHACEPWTYRSRPDDGPDPRTVCVYWDPIRRRTCDRPPGEHERVDEDAKRLDDEAVKRQDDLAT